jgi:serine O-acetyltransferase
MSLFSIDIKKYRNYSGKSSLVLLLTTQGFWGVFVYRIFNFIKFIKLRVEK